MNPAHAVNGRARWLLGVALVLALTATMAGPSALVGSSLASEDETAIKAVVEFAAEPSHSKVGEEVRSKPFGRSADSGEPVKVTVEVDRDDVDDFLDSAAGEVNQNQQDRAADEIWEALEEQGLDLTLTVDPGFDGEAPDLRIGNGDASESLVREVDLTQDGESTLAGDVAFDGLAVVGTARGLRLAASVDGLEISLRGRLKDVDVAVAGRATSKRFTVWEEVRDCSDGDCEVNIGDPGLGTHDGLSATLAGNVDGGFLGMTFTVEGQGATCGGEEYVAIPGPVLFEAIGTKGDGELVATLTISKDAVQEDVDNGRAKYDICYVSDKEFTGKDGTTVSDEPNGDDPLKYGPALLPTCGPAKHGPGAPCIDSRTGDGSGGAKIVVRLPAGDPIMR